MGNCVGLLDGGTTTIGGGGGGGGNALSLRVEDLPLLPGRIFSNAVDDDAGSSSSSLYTQQGRKGINQDAMILWEDFGGRGILCGVFDGHGPHGHLVARKARDVLPLKLLRFLPSAAPPAHNHTGCFSAGSSISRRRRRAPPRPNAAAAPTSLSAWRRAFVRSYKAMDRELRSHPTLDCFCSGSTGVTLLKMGSDLFMANIGDSRAILGSLDETGGSMVALQLTVDLKPDLPGEAERIKRCRGRVFSLRDEPNVPRVWMPFDNAPGLAMARAFGDFCLKDYGVISVPEFSHRTLTDRDRFVILASDGIWDVLSNKEVVDIVSLSPTRSSAAKVLVDAATRQWKLKHPTLKMDDCAVVCLYLDGEANSESMHVDNTGKVSHNFDDGCSVDEPNDGQSLEPSLERNFTVRSMGNARVLAVEGKNGDHGSTADADQKWLGFKGLTHGNSFIQLPRYSDEQTA